MSLERDLIERPPTMKNICDICGVEFYLKYGHTCTEKNHPPQVLMAGGKVASSKGPAFHLIPTVALVKLVERFELGQERKGDKAWNALSDNQECLLDKAWLIERCSHIIHHTLKLRDQLLGKECEESMTDNASAIAWGGMFLICGAEAIAKDAEDC